MASGRYGVTLKELRELMECRGAEGIARVRDHYGGVHGLANKLNSSEENGKTFLSLILLATTARASAARSGIEGLSTLLK